MVGVGVHPGYCLESSGPQVRRLIPFQALPPTGVLDPGGSTLPHT